MKRLIVHAIQAAFLCAWCSLATLPVLAQSNIIGGGIWGDVKVASGPSKSYTYAGSADNNGSVGNTWTVSTINIGPAVAGRLVTIGLAVQNTPTLTVTVNGVSMTAGPANTSANTAGIWYGTVATGSGAATIVVTGGNFLFETMLVYYATGLSSNTPVGTANGTSTGTLSAAVNSGDFIFATALGQSGLSSFSWSGSTQLPTGNQSDTTNSSFPGFAADWGSPPAGTFTFSTLTNIGGQQFAAANWR